MSSRASGASNFGATSMFDRILVPLDGSPIAEAILVHVRRFLRVRDADVILFQAVPLPVQAGLDYAPTLTRLKGEAEQYLRPIAERLKREGVNARFIVRVADEAHGILDVAREELVSLIAMATHGRSGLPRFVFGSVTEKVLRASDAPVLVMRSFLKQEPGALPAPATEVPIRRILVAVNGSVASLAVLPAVKALAKETGAAVAVIGVVRPHEEPAQHAGEPLIRLATNDIRAAGIPVDSIIRVGDPASEILDACHRHEIDLLAMATHGRSGPSRWMLGSVTEKVLRGAAIPLLVVRERK